jgi:hypothetical protein
MSSGEDDPPPPPDPGGPPPRRPPPGAGGDPAGPNGGAAGRPPAGQNPQQITRDQWIHEIESLSHLSVADFTKQRDAAFAAEKKLEGDWKDAPVLHEVQLKEDGSGLKGTKIQARLDMCPAGRISEDDPDFYMYFQAPEQSRLELSCAPDDPLPARVALRLRVRALAPPAAVDLAFVKLHVSMNSIPGDDASIYSLDGKAATVVVELRSWQKGQRNTVVLTLGRGASPLAISHAEILGFAK